MQAIYMSYIYDIVNLVNDNYCDSIMFTGDYSSTTEKEEQ